MKDTWWNGTPVGRMKLGLDRMRRLMDRLGHPEARYPIVHVAGTNGKGSTVAMLAAALRAQGWRVGTTISPDLGFINERVQIDGVPLAPAQWDRLGEQVERAGADLTDTPSFFEAVTALAFLAFAEHRVDLAVVEVGLGGRFDATNVVPAPLLTVITPIALDHTDRLGHTPQQIAAEKAAIIKPGSRVVVAEQPYPEAMEVIRRAAAAAGVPLLAADPDWPGESDGTGSRLRPPGHEPVWVPLMGRYQVSNLRTVWTALEVLHRRGWLPSWDRARQGLAAVRWPGRFEVVSRRPLQVWDGAHNLHGMQALVDTLRAEPWRQVRWQAVFGVLTDKPGVAMAQGLAQVTERLVLTRVPGERGTDPHVLRNALPRGRSAAEVVVVDDPLAAVRDLERTLGPDQGIVCCGSLALLAHLRVAKAAPV